MGNTPRSRWPQPAPLKARSTVFQGRFGNTRLHSASPLAILLAIGGCYSERVLSTSSGSESSGTSSSVGTTTATSKESATSGNGSSASSTTSGSSGATATGDDTTSTTSSSTSTTSTSSGGGSTTGAGGRGFYGDPANGCQPGEAALAIQGLEGAFCSPTCENMNCPPAPAGVDADPQCVLGTDPMNPTYCALICELANDSVDCPAGSTCKDIMQMGQGVCTYP